MVEYKFTKTERKKYEKYCTDRGIDPKVIDFDSIWDTKLTKKENRKGLEAEIKKLSPAICDKDLDFWDLDKYRHMQKEFIEGCIKDREEELLKEIEGQQEGITSSMWARRKEIIEEINGWNVHGEVYTWATLLCLLRKNRHIKFNVINSGKAGSGKTRATVDLVKRFNLPRVGYIKGHITPKKFYEKLKDHRDYTILVDESQAILDNKMINQLLRSAMYGDGEVGWESTTNPDDEDKFYFEGQIIFNTNDIGKKDAHTIALRDRCFVNVVTLTNREVMEKIEDTRRESNGSELWELVRKRLVLVGNSEVDTELTDTEKDLIYEFVKGKIEELGGGFHREISVRVIQRALEVFYRVKLLFGGLDRITVKLAKRITEQYITTEGVYDYIVKIVLEAGSEIKKRELVNQIVEVKKCSEKTAYRYVNKAIEEGKLQKTAVGCVGV